MVPADVIESIQKLLAGREAAQRAYISNADIAARCGVSLQTVYRVQRGELPSSRPEKPPPTPANGIVQLQKPRRCPNCGGKTRLWPCQVPWCIAERDKRAKQEEADHASV